MNEPIACYLDEDFRPMDYPTECYVEWSTWVPGSGARVFHKRDCIDIRQHTCDDRCPHHWKTDK